MPKSKVIEAILARLRELREAAGFTPEQLDERLILGPGWVRQFESGETVPGIDVLFVLAQELGAAPGALFEALEHDEASAGEIDRAIFAVSDGDDLLINFRYARHDAVYRLPNATLDEFETVLSELRDGLARLEDEETTAIKADSVAITFLTATRVWPHANPSDLWWFLVCRAYCDPFNHPARFARLNLDQSWKRTSGWALELVLVRFYHDFLARNGIRITIETGDERADSWSRFRRRCVVASRPTKLMCWSPETLEVLKPASGSCTSRRALQRDGRTMCP